MHLRQQIGRVRQSGLDLGYGGLMVNRLDEHDCAHRHPLPRRPHAQLRERREARRTRRKVGEWTGDRREHEPLGGILNLGLRELCGVMDSAGVEDEVGLTGGAEVRWAERRLGGVNEVRRTGRRVTGGAGVR